MIPQYSARYLERPEGSLEVITYDAQYVDDSLAVEFWADVFDHNTGETVIVTGRYFELWGDFEYVWVDHERLTHGHPLRTVVERDRELRTACERAYQHSRFAALDALCWPSSITTMSGR